MSPTLKSVYAKDRILYLDFACGETSLSVAIDGLVLQAAPDPAQFLADEINAHLQFVADTEWPEGAKDDVRMGRGKHSRGDRKVEGRR